MSNIYKRAFGRRLKMKFRMDVTRVVPLLPPQRSRRRDRQGRRQRRPCVNIAHASFLTLAALPPRLANIQMLLSKTYSIPVSKVAQVSLTHSTVMEGLLLEPKITGYQTQRVRFLFILSRVTLFPRVVSLG